MKKYKAFVVPFATKGYLNNEEKGYKIVGNAYYLYDKNFKIYKQFIQVDEANFRPTDKEMLITDYYNKKSIGIENIRKFYLEKYQLNLGYIKTQISKADKIRINLNKNLLLLINKEFLKLSRVKRSIDVFVGSNSSGSEQKKDASSIITYYKNDYSKSGYNFSNPFNRKEIFKDKNNIKINSLKELETITMDEFFKLNPKAESIFESYNFSQYYIFKDVSKSINESEIIEGIEKENELKKITCDQSESKVKDTLEKLIKYFKENHFENNKKESKSFEKRLRNIQKLLVIFEIKRMNQNLKKLKNNEIFNSLENCYDANSEFSHIIPVRESIKNSNYNFVADNSNCLLLPPNIHKNLDKFQIYFDENSGNCILLNGHKVIKNKCIKKEWMTNERKEYLKMYKKKYVKN